MGPEFAQRTIDEEIRIVQEEPCKPTPPATPNNGFASRQTDTPNDPASCGDATFVAQGLAQPLDDSVKIARGEEAVPFEGLHGNEIRSQTKIGIGLLQLRLYG